MARLPQVVVIDRVLPDMPGEEVARRLRSNPRLRTATLIALSGHDPDADDARRDFDHALLKPAALSELLECFPGDGAAARNPTA
jgi:CheY-like chemotaxis protein